MTTEDDFQRMLDAHPDDHHTRLVFADWLQDRDDPRADGYRALGALRLWPVPPWKRPSDGVQETSWVWGSDANRYYRPEQSGSLWDAWSADYLGHMLPAEWIAATSAPNRWDNIWCLYATRRAADDAAALAFAKLPVERRDELLACGVAS